MTDMTEKTSSGLGARPELIQLDAGARERVLDRVSAMGGYCEACGATNFTVGDAMIMGFLFLDEDADAYLVALTCQNPECPKPRSGIRLSGMDFLSAQQCDRAISLRSSIA
jgi:hypothetical protein